MKYGCFSYCSQKFNCPVQEYSISCNMNPSCSFTQCRSGYNYQSSGYCHDGGPSCRGCCYGDGNCVMQPTSQANYFPTKGRCEFNYKLKNLFHLFEDNINNNKTQQ